MLHLLDESVLQTHVFLLEEANPSLEFSFTAGLFALQKLVNPELGICELPGKGVKVALETGILQNQLLT